MRLVDSTQLRKMREGPERRAASLADALSEHIVDQSHLTWLNEPARRGMGILPYGKADHVQVRAIEGRRAREDAVIVTGKQLRLHQRVLPAGGTSVKNRPFVYFADRRNGCQRYQL